MALNFAPALKQWQLPLPTSLPKPAICLALRTPFVGIDILSDDVTPEELLWVICQLDLGAGSFQDTPIYAVSGSKVDISQRRGGRVNKERDSVPVISLGPTPTLSRVGTSATATSDIPRS
ncbi:hypothetical protein BDV95DRAFT_602209 [Massariosphaeria phaeospora]|uniref:Uncharacterized protein n=1 Tax=Massariosphaeria phaeospora TaxID=100035 RepID=A0A7C8ICG6_9PLEO|nr:hypothetical protein BDV95DRAFT_602209 [Massariosphaeria phaeospora]